jgi:Rad3-related DNA helicase
MAGAIGKTRCVICSKEKATLRCGGCLQEYCSKHLENHRQELNKQFDEIEVNRDLFRQLLTEQMQKPENNRLMEQINQWEGRSIEKIQQTADEARHILLKNTKEYIHEIEIKLNELTNQLRQTRQEDDFNEINLRHLDEELNQLTRDLIEPSNISIGEDSTQFIKKIFLNVSSECLTRFILINK